MVQIASMTLSQMTRQITDNTAKVPDNTTQVILRETRIIVNLDSHTHYHIYPYHSLCNVVEGGLIWIVIATTCFDRECNAGYGIIDPKCYYRNDLGAIVVPTAPIYGGICKQYRNFAIFYSGMCVYDHKSIFRTNMYIKCVNRFT